MRTDAHVIGFVGTDKHDIISYLAQILQVAGRKVLLIDDSETQALHCSIFYPIAMNPTINSVEYNNFTFVSKKPLANVEELEKFTDIIIDFGYHVSHPDLQHCTFVNFVTDLQKHNALRLLNVKVPERVNRPERSIEVKKTLLIRDIVKCKITSDYIKELTKSLGVTDENSYLVELDETDYILKLHSQYNSVYQFKQLSNHFKSYLESVVQKEFELNDSDFYKLWKIAEGGNKR